MKKPRTNGRNHGHPVRRKKSAPGHPVRRKVPRLFRPFSGMAKKLREDNLDILIYLVLKDHPRLREIWSKL